MSVPLDEMIERLPPERQQAVAERTEALVRQVTNASRPYEMWGFDGCPYCDALKAWMAARNLDYLFWAEADKERRQTLYEFWNREEPAPGQRPATSMPQVFMDGIRFGSADEVMAMDPEVLRSLTL